MKKKLIFFVIIWLACHSCKNDQTASLPDPASVIHNNENNLTDLVVYDIFSPPVAARIYAYTSLAAHEAIRHQDPGEKSIIARLRDFPEMPEPDKDKKYDFVLAASKAFYNVARQVTFSQDTIDGYEEMTYAPYMHSLDKETYENSIAFGESVANAVLQRVHSDNYKETRALEKYYGSNDAGKWRPTSPDYLDGIEPYWYMIKTMALDSANQFDPGPPPAFSTDTSSKYYQINKEVYDVSMNLSPEQRDIAYFWDDNPNVTHHAGHMMFNTKKQTPGGHWMGIATIACKQAGVDAVMAARTYAMTALGLYDAFISVFETKYKYSYIRPITVINEWIDPKWESYLQTPAFPEYTSGHSTITASAATMLTALYGDHFAFRDTSDMRYINMYRDFTSFYQASDECSISRLYGGIHYRLSVDLGAEIGRKVAKHVLKVLGY